MHLVPQRIPNHPYSVDGEAVAAHRQRELQPKIDLQWQHADEAIIGLPHERV